jgi:hypothetical protein
MSLGRAPILLLTLLALAACATPLSPPASPFRADLGREWRDDQGAIRWPADDGFAAAPVLMVLEPGMLIDRFGQETGRFFSPKGAGYGARALPYICAVLVYHVYRVEKPLLAWTGKAAPWFDQPGGATQIETDAAASQLLADGTLSPMPDTGVAPCPK